MLSDRHWTQACCAVSTAAPKSCAAYDTYGRLSLARDSKTCGCPGSRPPGIGNGCGSRRADGGCELRSAGRSGGRCPLCPQRVLVVYEQDSPEARPVLSQQNPWPRPCLYCGRPTDVTVIVEVVITTHEEAQRVSPITREGAPEICADLPDVPERYRTALARIIHPHRREKRANKLRPWSHKACVHPGSRRGEAACEAMGVSLEQLASSGKNRSPPSEHRGELVVCLLSRSGRRYVDSGSRPGAMTERRGGAGPVRGLLGGKTLTGRFL
jgi:hypothetical protein